MGKISILGSWPSQNILYASIINIIIILFCSTEASTQISKAQIRYLGLREEEIFSISYGCRIIFQAEVPTDIKQDLYLSGNLQILGEIKSAKFDVIFSRSSAKKTEFPHVSIINAFFRSSKACMRIIKVEMLQLSCFTSWIRNPEPCNIDAKLEGSAN